MTNSNTVHPAVRYAVFGIALGMSPVHAEEPLVLLDNFAARWINPDTWFGQENPFGDPGIGLEAFRGVERTDGNGRLVLRYRGYGDTASDSGITVSQFALRIRNTLDVTALKATIKVKNIVAVGCASNPSPTFARAALAANWFNTNVPVPDSRLNDVFGILQVFRLSDSTDPAGVLGIFASFHHCLSADCSTLDTLGSAFLGTVRVGRNVTLLQRWDAAGNQFIVQRDAQAPLSFPYTVSDAQPPSRTLKGLEVAPVVPNCTTLPRPVSNVTVQYDNVFTNESAAVSSATSTLRLDSPRPTPDSPQDGTPGG